MMSSSKQLLALLPTLTPAQLTQLGQLPEIYAHWNASVNLISRRDAENVMEHHVLHSLAILRAVSFRDGMRVLDFGTGGGFPGIPLAIACPEVRFHLVDSVGKKVRIVQEIAQALDLSNVTAEQVRGEQVKGEYSYVVSRGVTDLSQLWRWTKHLLRLNRVLETPNGLLAFKGGEALRREIAPFGKRAHVWDLHEFLPYEYYRDKSLVLIPAL